MNWIFLFCPLVAVRMSAFADLVVWRPIGRGSTTEHRRKLPKPDWPFLNIRWFVMEGEVHTPRYGVAHSPLAKSGAIAPFYALYRNLEGALKLSEMQSAPRPRFYKGHRNLHFCHSSESSRVGEG